MYPSLAQLTQNVERDGARYTLLARLSPIPSWLNNYGLAFAGVRIADYLPVTALTTLPPVLTHVYAGILLSSLRALTDGDGSGIPGTLAKLGPWRPECCRWRTAATRAGHDNVTDKCAK
mmetsp:Transcript_35976/g.81649  ORF Transcript_35976/g.81649 Transcript_35976/m.81649 type:complete len:119 (+) Transcript_35976:1043-1399(+)